MSMDRLLSAVQNLPTRTDIDLGFKGLCIGIIYSLKRADELGFVSRTGSAVDTDYETELDHAAFALSESGDMPREWLGGFYFNSALLRIAAVSHRVLRELLGTDKEKFKPLADKAVKEKMVDEADIDLLRKVYSDINDFKHDKAKLLRKREIETLAQGSEAAEQLLRLIQKMNDSLL